MINLIRSLFTSPAPVIHDIEVLEAGQGMWTVLDILYFATLDGEQVTGFHRIDDIVLLEAHMSLLRSQWPGRVVAMAEEPDLEFTFDCNPDHVDFDFDPSIH